MARPEIAPIVSIASLGIFLGGGAVMGWYTASSFAHDMDTRIISGEAAYTDQSKAPEIDNAASHDQHRATDATAVAVLGAAAFTATHLFTVSRRRNN